MKILLNVVIVSVMFLAGASYFMKTAHGDVQVDKLVITTKDGTKHSFDVEIAATPTTREVGLMFREHMDPDHGMLFEMGETAITQFWMKNTLISLDMLFITPDGTIKTIHENAVPQTLPPISSEVPVSAVGDKVIYPFFSPPAK